ncbi:hypothetical protein U3516DRAFT_766077 [Neocallimastix sp. 'constans']
MRVRETAESFSFNIGHLFETGFTKVVVMRTKIQNLGWDTLISELESENQKIRKSCSRKGGNTTLVHAVVLPHRFNHHGKKLLNCYWNLASTKHNNYFIDKKKFILIWEIQFSTIYLLKGDDIFKKFEKKFSKFETNGICGQRGVQEKQTITCEYLRKSDYKLLNQNKRSTRNYGAFKMELKIKYFSEEKNSCCFELRKIDRCSNSTIEHYKCSYRNLKQYDLKIKAFCFNNRIRKNSKVKLSMGNACLIANENEKISYVSSPFEEKCTTEYADIYILVGGAINLIKSIRASIVVDEISDDLTEEAIKTTSTAKKFCMTETYNSVKKNIK